DTSWVRVFVIQSLGIVLLFSLYISSRTTAVYCASTARNPNSLGLPEPSVLASLEAASLAARAVARSACALGGGAGVSCGFGQPAADGSPGRGACFISMGLMLGG